MMVDILHQLLKEVVDGTYMLQWLKTIIRRKFKEVCVKTNITNSLQQVNGTVPLDQRFYAIPFYPTLKIFKVYSKVKQWDESEYWIVFRQLVSVVTLLLMKDDLIILQCIQAIIDLVYMVQYKFHTDKTLCYIKHVFHWINQTKRAFKDVCQIDPMIRTGKKRHFNFWKWYVMLYYFE